MFVRGRAHPPEVVRSALSLADRGLGQRAIARELGLDPGTVANWLAGRIPRNLDLPRCPHCHTAHRDPTTSVVAYVYLLGLYLGDGHVSRFERAVTLRRRHGRRVSWIIEECAAAVALVRGRSPHVARHPTKNCVVASSYWRAWPCAFPQHGPGRKHTRKIELAPWQRDLVEADPRPFIRGLIHSDGWRGLNKVHVKGKDYAYPRYQFSNRSDDIRGLFCWACDLLGVEWRRWGRWHISVARRQSVATLDTFVGPKA